jgi:DnaK suppressor protein
MVDIERHKQQIEARLAELNDRLKNVDDALDVTADPDLADQAIELQDDEVLEGLGRAGEREIQLLGRALVRVENGTYGICKKCDEEIAAARLDAVPYAVLCRHCAGAAPK